MKNQILVLTAFLNVFISFAQTTVSEVVTDSKNNPIVGANVYIEGSYDGASTTATGKFSYAAFLYPYNSSI